MTARPEVMTADEAVGRIASGMTVAVTGLSAEPLALTAALWARVGALRNVTILTGMMLTGYPFLRPEMADAFKLRTWFMPGTLLGHAVTAITAEFLPLTWSQTARYLAEVPSDVALLHVSPADREGFHSLGISVSLVRAILRSSKLRIAQVNEAMPRTYGQALVHESELDIVVPSNHPLLSFPHRQADETDRAIGRFAAGLVPNGSTLQFGLGTIPGATVRGLIDAGRRDLRLLSQVSDPARELMEAGACVTDGPKARAGEILGSRDLYTWCHENKAIDMVSAEHTHSLAALAAAPNLVSINSALEVDLYGQVNTEFLDGHQAGGIGGSLDFAMGAQSDHGLSIIALPASTKQNTSRIVPRLATGAVTLPRALAHVVITEHGVADLRNLSSRQRALAIANLADPPHREALGHAAAQL